MKIRSTKSKHNGLLIAPVLAIGTLLLSPMTLAITPEEGRTNFIWQGFQGGPTHKGHIPVSLTVDNSPTKVSGWPMRALLTHPMANGSPYVSYHADLGDVSASTYVQFHQMLNQPTVVDDAVVLTNRGYLTPFTITHIDRITNHLTSFDYLDKETTYVSDANGDFLEPRFCTQSQSQVVYKDDIAYLATNYYELSSDDRLCDPTVDTPDAQFTHLRAHPIRPDKTPAGGQGLELNVQEGTKLAIKAHHKDQFLSPTLEGSTVYSQGGGLTSTRDHTGVFSIANSGSSAEVSITNNWASVNSDGYIKVAPNSLWSPAVNGEKVITFLNGTSSDDYRNNIPTLTEIDRTTGSVIKTQQLDSIDFMPTQETSFNVFNMATAPVLADDDTLVVINNGNLIFFDVSSNQFTAAPTPINGGFYGQPVVANDVIYVLSRDQAACPGYASCMRAISVTSKSPVKDAANQNWVWLPPSTMENLEFPFVATNSHVFVSSDSGNTFGVNAAQTINNASRLDMTYPLNGKLALAYDTLFIAHSADDLEAGLYSDLKLRRPIIGQNQVLALNTALGTAWTNHDADITTFTDEVKNNNASVIVALQFPLDETQVADLDVDLEIISPALATTIEIDQVITYEVTITNRGQLDASNVQASAVIPLATKLQQNFTGPVSCTSSGITGSLLTCDVDGNPESAELNTLASGDSVSFTFDVVPKVISAINMTVAADGSELNPDSPSSSNDDNSATVSIQSIAASPSSHDLSLSISPVGATTIDKDRTLTYQLTVSNAASAATALDVRLSYALLDLSVETLFDRGNCTSTSCTIDRLDAGASQSFTIKTKGIGPGQGGIQGSVASTRQETTDTDLTNNQASFNGTNVSNKITVESADQLPRAGGSWSWLLLLGSALLFRLRK